MSWDYDRSRERIEAHLDGMGEIEIEKLVREADLDTLLTETRCRNIYGAHVYVQVSNFTHMASQEPDDTDKYKEFIRATHIYQREVSKIVESVEIFDGLRIHFQGPKLHALFYRPIDDSKALASRAVLLQLVIKDFVRSVFNPAFGDCDDYTIAGGADLGNAIGTRNGSRGDRELLFIGSPANRAAKIISSSGRLRITGNVYDALGDDLQEVCEEIEDGLYKIKAVGREDLDDLLNAYKIEWDRDKSTKRVERDKERFPLGEIVYNSAETLIKLDDLSIRNNKRVLATSIFADVSGFTKYVESAETEDDQKKALRVFHAIRKEMARVIKNDFGGLRVQFQGDRVQGLFHLPKDEEKEIVEAAVNAAIGLQSSMEHSIKDCLPEAKELSLAIGIDVGTTLVSKLGTRAHRDRICLGDPVECAAIYEERISGKQIGISKRGYEALSDEMKNHFSYSNSAQCYVANDLTSETVERSAKARSYNAGGAFFIKSDSTGITINKEYSSGATSIVPSRPYATKG